MHPIETPDKTFHDGDGVSELGTILPAWWLNQIQAELLAVLTAAGIQPNKAKTNQLADAIKQIFRDGVMLTGNQTVGGKKTFSESTDFAGGLRISGNNTEQWSGFYRGNADWYWNNPIAGKALQFNDDGTLALSGDKILLYTHCSNAVNLDRADKIATSKAVKIVNDKIEQAAPSGEVAYFAGRNAPAGWLKANGAAVSRTTYANLFAAIGTTYGAGDGRTTFNLPDLRGEFIRSWDDGRAIDSNRALGSWQADEFRRHSHGIGVNRMPDTDRGSNSSTVSVDTVGQTDPAGGIETRPRNIALLACIKI